MRNFDWTRFSVAINIRASSDVLYKAWATRKGIEEWFLRVSDYHNPEGIALNSETEVNPGDTYRWLWHGWPDESAENGTIIDANGSDFMRFSFGKAGICSVRINPHENEYIVHLTQEEIPETEEGRQTWHIGCKTGWTFYLANLKSVLEGGIDLRNRDVSMVELLNK